MNGRRHNRRFLAASAAYLALLLLSIPEVSFAGMHHRVLTDLSLEELLTVEVYPSAGRVGRPRTDTVAAIRAGCSDGMDICDALHAILSSSASPGRADARQNTIREASYAEGSVREASAETVEYNVPPPLDPHMIAGPNHAAFGGAQTVDGAMRALGLGL